MPRAPIGGTTPTQEIRKQLLKGPGYAVDVAKALNMELRPTNAILASLEKNGQVTGQEQPKHGKLYKITVEGRRTTHRLGV